MYQINDMIVYKNSGVCRIEDIGIPCFVETQEQYYQITPIFDLNGKLYVKINRDKLMFRSITSLEEAELFLSELPSMNGIYNANDKTREKEYRDILKACECKQCLSMLKGILRERNKKLETGKTLNMTDERNLQRVEKLLNDEFSIVFNITTEQAKLRINNAMF
ncbi:CarD family transcriptional regulator [Anaerocolumna sp. MB42-C2]|uniref:CarD family transcriptional regulator n=1 Tax=Anaerocolumna sp. MB42-C2 TaxID=3070997 RepID=UPI0027DF9249|nr:CarD family transcriptional regulator [Anaerocolumna sp. MB42-C2]WMJ89033.1 CarD family transcriptional regulator [Anaerocolumna sp. MB42-C2]